MRPQLRLDGMTLRLDGAGAAKHRQLGEADTTAFESWATRYRDALEVRSLDWRERRRTQLLALGLEIGRWLDSENWLSVDLARAATTPWIVEFMVDHLRADDSAEALAQSRFLEAPWELVADQNGHLAADFQRMWLPVRRIGHAETPPDDPNRRERLSVLFMAAAPIGAGAPLAYEREEYAILQACRDKPLDLFVEDSGELEPLRDTWANRLGRPDIVHLSGHGDLLRRPNAPEQPVLVLEDELGNPRLVTADEVATAFAEPRPRLFALAACHTGETPAPIEGAKPVEAFARALVSAGAPAAIGFAAPVFDTEATRFAALFYGDLAQLGRSLEAALATARYRMAAEKDGAGPSADWHLPRLYLGKFGGGTWTRGNRRRALPVDAGQSAVLGATGRYERHNLPVAGRYEFVGRRRELKAILCAFRASPTKPVMIHGFGGQGKTSLAARVLERNPSLRPVAIWGTFSVDTVLDAIGRSAKLPLSDAIAAVRARVKDEPGALYGALRDILVGPCGFDGEPILLLLDDLEQALALPVGEHGAPTLNDSATMAALGAILRAFADSDTPSRLLLTSRYRFTLPWSGVDLGTSDFIEQIALPSMPDADRQKQLELRLESLRARNRLSRPDERTRFDDAMRWSFGNARLQDVLTRVAVNEPATADRIIVALEQRAASDVLETIPSAMRQEVAFIAMEELTRTLSDGDRRLLGAVVDFSLPVPLQPLLRAAGYLGWGNGNRLGDLGLWTVLGSDEAARVVENHLLAEFVPLPALDDDSLRSLAQYLPAWFLRRCGETASQTGNPSRARLCLDLSLEAAQDGGDSEGAIRDRAQALVRKAELEIVRGEIAIGERLAQQAISLFKQIGDVRSLSVALHVIARIKFLRGDLDGALALHEKRLMSEVSGDLRERAVTLGEIARIKSSRGDIQGALALHSEELREYERIGDFHARAVTLGDIARIKASRGDVDGALAMHEEQLEVFKRLGYPREQAVALGDIANLRTDCGDLDGALALHNERLEIFERLGEARERAVTLGDIARIKAARGHVDDALALHEERLEIFKCLGIAREEAVALGDIAHIKADRGDLDDALGRQRRRLEINQYLGDKDGIATANLDLGYIYRERLLVVKAPSQEMFDATMNAFATAWTMFNEIERIEGIAISGAPLAQLLLMAGAAGRAKSILERAQRAAITARREDVVGELSRLMVLATQRDG